MLQYLGSSKGEPLLVEPLTKAVLRIDVHYPVLLAGYTAPLVGDGDDVVELLADVDGDDEIATLRSQ